MKDNQPIRLFNSPRMEMFTHTHPIMVFIFWITILTFLLNVSISSYKIDTVDIVLIICGFVFWTFVEYIFHRWLLHLKYFPKTDLGRKVKFLIHELHHLEPRIKTRLVLPIPISSILGLLWFSVFCLISKVLTGNMKSGWLLFIGFGFGYLVYDLLHYAIHHCRFKFKLFKMLKINHLRHHFRDNGNNFGISTPLWDYIFKTNKE